jgi:hypothetical protein
MRTFRAVLRSLGAEIRFVRGDLPPRAQPATGIEYWLEGLERQMPRWYEILWHGHTLIRVRSRHNERAYWRPRHDLVRLIEEMQAAAILGLLNPAARVFEPGCNVAQNLWELSRRWRCQVVGLDIDAGALSAAARRRWPRPPQFILGNVLDAGTLARFPDGYFDLVFTRWHLIHVPQGEAKQRYLAELRRIGRTGLVLEPVNPAKTGTVEWASHGTYCLSWDDWGARFTPFHPKKKIHDTAVFYWTS